MNPSYSSTTLAFAAVSRDEAFENMPRHSEKAYGPDGNAEEDPMGGPEDEQSARAVDAGQDFLVDATTVGVICVGAALFEAALIPGMIIGVVAMLAPKALPRLGDAIEPAFRSAVRGAYKVGQKARYVVSEAEEQIRDVIAEENATAKSGASET